MSISEQVKELRYKADIFEKSGCAVDGIVKAFRESADTIEALSAKMQAANEELERWHTDKVNEKIKNPFAWTSTLCCHNCDHKDEYIEELEASDMERPAEDCSSGWIACEDRLPEEEVKVFVWFEYFRYGEYNRLFQTIGISYTYNGQWSGFVNDSCGWDELRIIAWQPLPDPYHEP